MNKVLFTIVIVLALLVGGSLLYFSVFAPKTPPAAPVIQYSPSPTTFVSSKSLTPEENSYPEVSPQRFFSEDSNQSGVLVVTTNPSEARVMIDSEEEEVSTETTLPVNITPFKISNIPVGQHNLTLFTQGYNFSVVQFKIEANKITRLDITLTPQEPTVGY